MGFSGFHGEHRRECGCLKGGGEKVNRAGRGW